VAVDVNKQPLRVFLFYLYQKLEQLHILKKKIEATLTFQKHGAEGGHLLMEWLATDGRTVRPGYTSYVNIQSTLAVHVHLGSVLS
jgi:penicillin-binding protein-related factor A (putative recombinase)